MGMLPLPPLGVIEYMEPVCLLLIARRIQAIGWCLHGTGGGHALGRMLCEVDKKKGVKFIHHHDTDKGRTFSLPGCPVWRSGWEGRSLRIPR